jgi:hypothetical protein
MGFTIPDDFAMTLTLGRKMKSLPCLKAKLKEPTTINV